MYDLRNKKIVSFKHFPLKLWASVHTRSEICVPSQKSLRGVWTGFSKMFENFGVKTSVKQSHKISLNSRFNFCNSRGLNNFFKNLKHCKYVNSKICQVYSKAPTQYENLHLHMHFCVWKQFQPSGSVKRCNRHLKAHFLKWSKCSQWLSFYFQCARVVCFLPMCMKTPRDFWP